MYSEDPQGDVDSGRADTYKPTKIDRGWIDQPDEAGDDAGPAAEVKSGRPPPVEDPGGRPAEALKQARR